jgi:hypothetical protein
LELAYFCNINTESDDMKKQPSKPKKMHELSTAGRVRVVLGVGLICLAWMKYLSQSNPSGRWGWVETLVIQYVGKNGFFIILSVGGVLLVVSALSEMIRASKGVKK